MTKTLASLLNSSTFDCAKTDDCIELFSMCVCVSMHVLTTGVILNFCTISELTTRMEGYTSNFGTQKGIH